MTESDQHFLGKWDGLRDFAVAAREASQAVNSVRVASSFSGFSRMRGPGISARANLADGTIALSHGMERLLRDLRQHPERVAGHEQQAAAKSALGSLLREFGKLQHQVDSDTEAAARAYDHRAGLQVLTDGSADLRAEAALPDFIAHLRLDGHLTDVLQSQPGPAVSDPRSAPLTDAFLTEITSDRDGYAAARERLNSVGVVDKPLEMADLALANSSLADRVSPQSYQAIRAEVAEAIVRHADNLAVPYTAEYAKPDLLRHRSRAAGTAAAGEATQIVTAYEKLAGRQQRINAHLASAFQTYGEAELTAADAIARGEPGAVSDLGDARFALSEARTGAHGSSEAVADDHKGHLERASARATDHYRQLAHSSGRWTEGTIPGVAEHFKDLTHTFEALQAWSRRADSTNWASDSRLRLRLGDSLVMEGLKDAKIGAAMKGGSYPTPDPAELKRSGGQWLAAAEQLRNAKVELGDAERKNGGNGFDPAPGLAYTPPTVQLPRQSVAGLDVLAGQSKASDAVAGGAKQPVRTDQRAGINARRPDSPAIG